jgi:MATE family multidrug resistance protein
MGQLNQQWTRGQLAKSILLLGIPLIVGELGSIAQQFADTMMVGHYGTRELAAAGFVNSIFYFVIFLSLGMSFASTPLVGSAFGRKDYKEVYRIFQESMVVNLLVGLFFVVLLLIIYFNLETLFFNPDSDLFHQPYEILDLSRSYMLTLIVSIPFMTLFNACKQYLDGIGITQVSMWVMLFANVLNIFLNWCLIFGHCGFEPMGLLGAGLSTLISRVVQLVIILIVVYKSKIVSKYFNASGDHKVRPTMSGIREQVKLGLPITVQLGLEIGTFNVCGIFMGWLGALPLAAHQTMYTISTLCFQVLYGIGAAGTILISQFYGVKAWENIRRTASTAFMLGLIAVLLLTVGIWVFFEPLASCFTNDADVVEIMWLILPSFVLYQLGDCTQIVYANALRGIEDTKPLAFIAGFSYILICIPLSYLIAFTLGKGIVGVWMGIPIGLTLAGILFFVRFRKKLNCISMN